MALPQQVHTGPATIRSNVSGTQVEEYTVEILKVYEHTGDSRDLMLKVTDPRLLAQTGGIVQGMSGSPILQDGKLVGAVTPRAHRPRRPGLRHLRPADAGAGRPDAQRLTDLTAGQSFPQLFLGLCPISPPRPPVPPRRAGIHLDFFHTLVYTGTKIKLGRCTYYVFEKSRGVAVFLVLALLLSLLVLPAQAAEEAIGVTINGTPVTYDDGYGRPFVDAAGRTQVPFRLTMETFGCTVDWDNDTRTAMAEKDGTKVEVPWAATISSSTANAPTSTPPPSW